MVEIINGDPLSGLLTTIGFFIALLVGRYIGMRQVAGEGKRRAIYRNETSEQEKGKDQLALHHEYSDTCRYRNVSLPILSQKMKFTLTKKDIVPEWNPAEVLGAGVGHNGSGKGVFKDIDARILLSAAFVSIVALAAVKRWYVPAAVFAVIFFITIDATPSFKSYLTKLMYPLIVAVFLFFVQAYTYGSTVALTAVFPVYNEGIASGWLLFTRVLASVSILLLLVESTSPEELIESLAWFKIPVEIRNMASLMFRYTSVLMEEFKTMFNAQKSRLGYSAKLSWIKKLKNIAIIGGMLLVRSYDRSNKVIMSMMARGYTQNVDIARKFARFTRKDYLFAALSLMFIACIVLIGVR